MKDNAPWQVEMMFSMKLEYISIRSHFYLTTDTPYLPFRASYGMSVVSTLGKHDLDVIQQGYNQLMESNAVWQVEMMFSTGAKYRGDS